MQFTTRVFQHYFLVVLVFLVVLGFLMVGLLSPTFPNKRPVVAITQIVAHPSLDLVYRGIIDALQERGFEDQATLDLYASNANGQMSIAAQIATHIASLRPDVVVAITTPSAQAVLNAIKKHPVPVVFASVTDPVKSGLVESLVQPHPYVTGTMNKMPLEEQLELMYEFIPELRHVGVIINAGEQNSVDGLEIFKHVAEMRGIQTHYATVASTLEVRAATQSLIHQVDAMLLLQDNTVASALGSLVSVADAHGVPVFSTYVEAIECGAVAGVAVDEYEIGKQTGYMVAAILEGVLVSEIPISAPDAIKRVIDDMKVRQLFPLKTPSNG